jgi:RHH-type proline utilization regulon transcriptional repressor/proline dehydrogenase/delta 1-pyrroline-5-carboxylate dehydrogenase
VTLVQLTDQSFRSREAARTADQFTHILDVQGVPRFFNPLDRALLRGFRTFGGWLPGVAVPLVKEHMQQETANVVLPAEPELLTAHLRARGRDGVRMNVNFLGEAVLGEEEAGRRLERNLEALQLPEVEVVSVKISTLYSQVSALAREDTLRVVCDRLELLFRESAHLRFVRPDGTSVPKFIYLDMEEYRDLHLTAQAFMRTLDRPGLGSVGAGIALQAYIPDSARVRREITAWAKARVAGGGAPVTIRLVKGANMEMERIEAAHRDWPQAPFTTKRETDANFQRMLREAMQPENLEAVRIGVASHNLFDLAHGLVLASAVEAGDRVQFEMLEGMANHQRRALLEHTRNLLLYAPACRKEDFLNAIAYLIRRLDENTGPENFLRHAFRLQAGSTEWNRLERGFREASTLAVSDAPRRTQDRRCESHDAPRAEMDWTRFENEPDTDWSLTSNGEWAAAVVGSPVTAPVSIPLVVDGGECLPGDGGAGECRDPSRPGVVAGRFRLASDAEVDEALACARLDPDGWRALTVDARSAVLGRVAMELRRARGPLMRAALSTTGKTLAESDPEVSEAVDFVEFYRATGRMWHEGIDGLRASPRGVVVVVSPWNFPIAIPCGGVAAALASGNTVILKPSSDAVLVGWELCQCFWRGGVSRRVLQFLPCPGGGAGARLVTDPRVDAVILTGGTATARHILGARPDVRLFAETGGKNATIVTAMADRELAVRHVVQSAFGHSGQKCSATSLLLLEAELFDDPDFRRMLVDAARSLRAGPAWELATKVGPLIRPPSGDLETALMTLEPGESWALLPRPADDNPALWSPGIKWGVSPGSFTHLTELFGPVLGVMRYARLDEAIAIVNQTGYGLTSGLHSLDEREHSVWARGILAGNLYLNRSTTGAVVLRQPFGGLGKSCFGPGMKAGGPNYLAQFLRFEEGDRLPPGPPAHPGLASLGQAVAALADRPVGRVRELAARATAESARGAPGEALDQTVARVTGAIASYDRWWRDEFSRGHDHFRLLGQDNIRRYLPFHEIRVRVGPGDSVFDIIARAAAAHVTGARVVVSQPPDMDSAAVALLDELTDAWAGGIEFLEESDDDLAAAIDEHAVDRIRFGGPGRVPGAVRSAAARAGHYIADEPVLSCGRVELLWYLREQSLCHDYHRYGNLGARADEPRRPVR